MDEDELTRIVVRSSFYRYAAEGVLAAAGAVACVVMGALNHRLLGGAALGAVIGVFGALALRHAASLWPVASSRAFRAISEPSGGRDALGWAYLVRRGGPIGPWAGCLQLRFLDGARLRLHTSAANAEALLDSIATRVPEVSIGYTAEAERTYKQRRTA